MWVSVTHCNIIAGCVYHHSIEYCRYFIVYIGLSISKLFSSMQCPIDSGHIERVMQADTMYHVFLNFIFLFFLTRNNNVLLSRLKIIQLICFNK